MKSKKSLSSPAAHLNDFFDFIQTVGRHTHLIKKHHAGLLGKYFIENLAGIPVDVEYASEYRYSDFILDRESLVVVISQSGETADSLAALRAVKKREVLSLAICNVVSSSIARESDGVLYTHAGPEIGVAATKTFSAQMAALALLAIHLGQIRERLDQKESLSLIQELQRIPHKMEITTTRDSLSRIKSLYLYSEAYSTSTGIPARFSMKYFPSKPA